MVTSDQIGVGLMVFQQFGGISGICFYVSSIFESVGFPSNFGTIVYACLQVVITALGALLIDRAGRKPLLLISASGLVLGCLLTAVSFYLKTYEIALKAAPALAVTGILLYIGSFSAGMGAVPWVVMSEEPSFFMPQLMQLLLFSWSWWCRRQKEELWNKYKPPLMSRGSTERRGRSSKAFGRSMDVVGVGWLTTASEVGQEIAYDGVVAENGLSGLELVARGILGDVIELVDDLFSSVIIC
ncbi:hypothetical protein RJ640_019822 [Escallonia rubra]|uniref:Major facilitator superfamily (MFS) profile domain-containing protein n=1 Tax=Escallonia rubra TaxID=112253 RepID=A0AA88UVD3_9ASTE|nr:hypothetical protein RJ640_019822 [Escallonia rubra]